MKRRSLLWFLYSLVLVATTLGGAETVAWIATPSWPGYLLRPAPVGAFAIAQWAGGMPDITFAVNSWQMRDREHSLAKPPDVAFRTLFVGDSFLEGGFTRAALPQRVEGLLVEARQEDAEVINLGVAGTSPIEYFYRIREVALKLAPDAIVLVFYSGNDAVSQPFPKESDPEPFLAELPRPSMLANIAPHLAWQAVNAFRLSGAAGGKYAPHEHEIIGEALRKPPAEGLPMLVKLMHEYYFPHLSEAAVREVLARGGDRFWSQFVPRRFDREYLQGWILDGLISMETTPQKLAMTKPEADAHLSRSDIEATMSWLAATDRLTRSHGVKLLVAVAPVSTVDPDFADFWQPWPRYYSVMLGGAAVHDAMVAALAGSGIRYVDLQDDLEGVRGSYRKSDMHWTELGHEVVAKRLAREVMSLR